MRIWFTSVACFASMAAHAQTSTSGETTSQLPTILVQPVQEASPSDVFSTEDCNLACQIARMQFTPGGGSGLTLGKEIQGKSQINGLELGIERPSAEQLQQQMPLALKEKFNIQ